MVGGRVAFGRSSSLQPEEKDRSEEHHQNGHDIGHNSPELNSAKDLEQVAGLLYCACKGDVEGLEQLLNDGLSVDAADFDDRTALHLAACEGHLKVIEFLISKGANVNHADRWGSTVCSFSLFMAFVFLNGLEILVLLALLIVMDFLDNF